MKDWRHFDGQVKNSFSGIQDPILYNVMWGAWDTAVANDASAQGSDGFDGNHKSAKNEFDEDDDGTVVGDDSGFMDGRRRLRPDPDEDDDQGQDEDVSEISIATKSDRATTGGGGNKRKRPSGSSTAPASSRVAGGPGMGTGIDTKKYDLQKIAKIGTGRVMFVFEKKKDSQMGEVGGDVGGEDSEE